MSASSGRPSHKLIQISSLGVGLPQFYKSRDVCSTIEIRVKIWTQIESRFYFVYRFVSFHHRVTTLSSGRPDVAGPSEPPVLISPLVTVPASGGCVGSGFYPSPVEELLHEGDAALQHVLRRDGRVLLGLAELAWEAHRGCGSHVVYGVSRSCSTRTKLSRVPQSVKHCAGHSQDRCTTHSSCTRCPPCPVYIYPNHPGCRNHAALRSSYLKQVCTRVAENVL